MHPTRPSRRAALVRLSATIAGTEQRVRWRRFVMRVMAVLGRDAPQARAVLRRAEFRLASLRRDRHFLFRLRAR